MYSREGLQHKLGSVLSSMLNSWDSWIGKESDEDYNTATALYIFVSFYWKYNSGSMPHVLYSVAEDDKS